MKLIFNMNSILVEEYEQNNYKTKRIGIFMSCFFKHAITTELYRKYTRKL